MKYDLWYSTEFLCFYNIAWHVTRGVEEGTVMCDTLGQKEGGEGSNILIEGT